MLNIAVECSPSAFHRLESALEDGARDIMSEAAQRTASTARMIHGYTTRTGNMERNTLATKVSGSLESDTLQSAAIGFTPYASKLEARRDLAFLRPAWTEFVEPQMQIIAEAAFARAFQRVA